MANDGRFEIRHERHFGDRVLGCYHHRPASIMESFAASLGRAPDADCLVCDGERLSYRQVNQQMQALAAQLTRRGVEPGDRVALLLGNSPELVLALLGILRLGAIAVPMNTREQRAGTAYVLNHCQARAVIFAADQAVKLPEAQAAPALRHRFSVGDPVAGAEPFTALLDGRGAEAPEPEVKEEDTAVILYTSGTTGQPKGVMLTHFNIVHSLMHFQQTMALGEGERSVLVAPASHVTGLVANILTMVHVAGCTVILRQFDALEFVRVAAEERVTHAVMVPAMYNLCLLRVDLSRFDLSAWRIGGFGGAPMPEATIAKLHEKLPNLDLINAYGATETTSPVTVLPPGDAQRHPDSVGVVVPCGEVRIMDDQGREVAPGAAGELWISGPMVVPGYWNNPEASNREFVGGYWCSGDIGSVDRQGYIRVFDRKKDMINRGGYNIYSVELENLISGYPGVAECAVVARPDPVLGEKIHVFVSLADTDAAVDEAGIKRFCAEHLADYKVPDFVTLQDAPLPRNANGKLIKATLRGLMQKEE